MSGKMFVAKQDASDVYSMFGIEKATAVKVGDTIYATVYVNPPKSGVFTYSYMYFGTRTALIAQLDAGGKFDVVGASGVDSDLNKQIYHFTLPADKAGTRVPICVLKSDLTAKSPYNSSELELMVPADIPEGKVTPVPTPKDYPAAPATERDVTGLAVVDRETSAVYADFTITSATGIKVNGQTYLTALVKADEAGNFPYSYLYFGTLEQLKEQLGKGGAFDVVGYAANGEMRSYHFTLSADELDDTRRVPVCLLKADLKAENAYNTTELVLTIPETIEEKNSEAAKAIPTLPDDLSDAKIKVIKAADGKNFKMFTAGKTGMVIAGDKLLVRFETPNPAFSRLYFGSKEDGFKSPYVQGKETATGGWVFEFELPASYRGANNSICLGKPDGTWYNNQDLLISIPADTGDTAVVRDNAEIIMAPTSSWTQVSFVIGESSAMLLKDRIYITITGKMGGTEAGKTATKLYLGSRNDADKSGCIIGTVNEDGTTTFSFSVSADKQGTSILAVAGYADGSWHTNQDFFLNIPNFNRGFDLSYYTDGVYDLYGNAYAYLDKVDNRGLAVDDGSTLTVSGDQITIKWVTRASDTDKLYFGQLSDDAAAREAQAIASTDAGTLNWKVFTITLPKSALNTMIPFMRHSPLWFQDTSGWLEKQDYLVLMNCLPRIGDLPDDTGTTIDPAGMKMLSGGSEVEQMFVITASSATLRGDTITCTITGRTAGNNSGKTADKLYLGSRFDKDKTSYITGTVNGDGTTTFVFDVSADKQGTSIPVVIGHTDGGWDATQDYFLNIPNFDGSFDLSYYTDGVYDLYGNAYAELSRTENKSFPVDKGSTLSISGDKVVIKWVCRSGSYDKVYFGLASDDEATRNAGAVAFEDYAGEATWKVYTVTLSKSALSARIPFARHSTKWYTATNGWLTTQDYLVLANRLPKLSSTPDIPVDPTDPSEPSGEIKDGYYQVTTECSASMFKIIDAKLKVVNGKMTAELTLSGTGYDYLYAGTGAQAENDKNNWAPFTENAEGKYVYTIPVSELDKEITISSHSEKNNKWYDRTVTFLSASLKKIGDVDPTDPSEPSGEIKDGYYQVTTECSASMFKIIDAKLKVVNGQMMAELTLSGQGYDYLYAGTGKEAKNDKDNWAPFTVNADGKYVYTIPVSELDKEITISSHSKKNDEWYDRVVKFLSASLKKIGDVDPTEPTEPTSPSEPDTSGSTSKVDNSTTLKDGEYKPDGFTFSGGSGRVKIVCDKVIVEGGKAYAVIRFVSTSGSQTEYKYVKASGSVFYPTASGKFTIPVALNANNRILGMTSKMSAAHEIEYILNIQLKDGEPTDPTDPTTPTDPTEPTTPTDPTTPTSPSEPDVSGSTSAVNSNTTLKDGEYKPDGFTFSGGSGRVKIVCDKVIVEGGKAYAVIRFVSTSGSQTEYKYVKASGGVFYPTSDGPTSDSKFTIPVALNANNRILGMTSKMSAAHEIEYSIYVQLKKAQSATSTGSGGSLSTEEEEKDDPDSKLDKTAPEILGLEFKENIKTSGARYLKLFQYDQGVVLAEVDLRRDTVLDTDEAAKALAQADKEAKEVSQTVQSDEPADTAQITSDYVAAQYQGDILKYLLVPAGVELPAGLEKDYLIVSVPASNVYLMDETLAGTLDQLGALKNVSVVPEDCEDATLYDMLETGEKLPGGTWEKPDYRTLIKEKVALGLIGTEPLPLSEQALTERKETVPEREELTAVEYRDRLTKLTDRFAVLDIPLVVDRSADEPGARGQAAWLKLYGILFGKQDAAGKLYDAAIAKEDNA